MIILEFESVEAAQAWYDSPEYQACIPLREGAVEVNGVMVQGRDERDDLAGWSQPFPFAVRRTVDRHYYPLSGLVVVKVS